jgi:hypothetical protein
VVIGDAREAARGKFVKETGGGYPVEEKDYLRVQMRI